MRRAHGFAFRSMLVIAAAAALGVATAADDNSAAINKSEVLATLIQKKKLDAFHKELSGEGLDVNQPTKAGQILLIEAVKTKKIEFVDPLIQYGATVNVKEPGTGASPILLAFQNNLAPIAELLLAYGADPTVPANNGKKASDVMASGTIKVLFERWEKDGAMAFEETPGSWTDSVDGTKGVTYWVKRDAKVGQWNLPPACAWQRIEHRDALPTYTNFVTGQKVHKRPPALSWVRLNSGDKQLWYNWVANVTQFAEPREMPKDMIDEAQANVNRRWYNEVTSEYCWEDPIHASPWRKVKDAEAAEGQMFYFYNIKSGESQWDLPEELAWVQQDHDESGQPFWYNTKTTESTWEKPHVHGWVEHNDDL